MQKRTNEAIEDLTSAISLDSTNTFAYFNRALVRYDNKNIMGALEDLERVLKLDPGNALTLYNRALIRSQIGDYNNAIDDYDRVISINPNNVLAYYNRASVFVQLGRFRDAMDDYSQAINLYPDFANAYMNRSYVKNQLGQFTSAKSDYDIAQKKVSEYRTMQSDSLGVSAFADTTRKYDRLIALDADFAKRDFNNELLQYRDVDIRLKPLYKFRPDSETKEIIALEKSYRDKKMDEFTSSLLIPVSFTSEPPVLSADDQRIFLSETDKRLQREKSAEALFSKALLESGNKQFNTALECYNQAIALEPDQTFYYINRGALQSEMIDFISSMESNVQVLTLDNAGATRAKVKEHVTRSYDYTAAIHDMKRAAELSPELPYIYYNLGNLYCLSNDLPESIIQYSKAIELFPYIGEAYYNRGLVQIYLQDKEKGCLDMSKAGELGIPEAYSVIKKYCTQENK
jgi:tetratricopeptide (TPR) repeat protein